MQTTLPSLDNIIQSVQDDNICDEELQDYYPEQDTSNWAGVWYDPGNWGLVFKMLKGKEKRAFRVWHRQIPGIKERYKLILDHLNKTKLPYFVTCAFVEEGLYVDEQYLSTSRMEWADGLNLRQYVEKNLEDSRKLLRLADSFLAMFKDLHAHGISHGDLHHDNIIIDINGAIKLVDYDSVHVPALSGMPDIIHGKPEYQHLNRKDNRLSSEKADYFSELVIYLSLLALAENPSLRSKYITDNNTDTLLIRKEYFINAAAFNASNIKSALLELSPSVVELVKVLEDYLKENDINNLKPFLSYAKVLETNSVKISRTEDVVYSEDNDIDKIIGDKIIVTMGHYNIGITSIKAIIGPTVTLYEIIPNTEVRISKIKNLADDIALSLATLSISINIPIPGKNTVIIEVPNRKKEMINIKPILTSEEDENYKLIEEFLSLADEKDFKDEEEGEGTMFIDEFGDEFFVEEEEGTVGTVFVYDDDEDAESEVEYYYQRAQAMVALKNYKGAIEDYDTLIENYDKDYYYERAQAKVALKDYKGAIEDYDTLIELEPTESEYYHERGKAKKELEDYEGAIEDYDTCIELDPYYEDSYIYRGIVKNKLGDHIGSVANYLKAIEIDPNSITRYLEIGMKAEDTLD